MKQTFFKSVVFLCTIFIFSAVSAQGVHITKGENTVTVYSNDVDSLVFFAGQEGPGTTLEALGTGSIDELQQQILVFQEELDKLKTSIQSDLYVNNQEMAKIDTRVMDLEKRSSTFLIQITALEKSIASYENTLAVNVARLENALKADLDRLVSAINAIDARLRNVEASLANNRSNAASYESAIQNLTEKIAELEKQIGNDSSHLDESGE